MRKFCIFFIGYAIAFQAKPDYYEEFAKQYEKDHPEIVYPQKKFLTGKEVMAAWDTAHRNFRPGYRPVFDENGVLLDWVPRRNCPND